jgi:hypothetical protein
MSGEPNSEKMSRKMANTRYTSDSISIKLIFTFLRTEASATPQLQDGLALEMPRWKLGLEKPVHGHGGVPL